MWSDRFWLETQDDVAFRNSGLMQFPRDRLIGVVYLDPYLAVDDLDMHDVQIDMTQPHPTFTQNQVIVALPIRLFTSLNQIIAQVLQQPAMSGWRYGTDDAHNLALRNNCQKS